MIAHGRAARGERHGRTTLTEANVRAIRQSKLPARVLAERYQVHPATIANIRRRYTWGWLE